jgi:hypothetical protein
MALSVLVNWKMANDSSNPKINNPYLLSPKQKEPGLPLPALSTRGSKTQKLCLKET